MAYEEESGNPEVAFGFIFIVGIFLFVSGLITLKQKRLIENIPTSKIRSLAMGLVELFGSVEKPIQTYVIGPFTNRECVYYRYTIEEYRTTHTKHGTSHHWQTISTGTNSVPFYLKDETGRVLIDSKGANIDIPSSFQYDTNNSLMPATLKEYLNLHGKKVSFSIGGGLNISLGTRRRYTEYVITHSENLYILGTAGSNPYTANVLSKEHTNEIMVQKGKFEKFYLISNKPEKELLQIMNLKLWGSLVLGIILIAICVGYVSFEFNNVWNGALANATGYR